MHERSCGESSWRGGQRVSWPHTRRCRATCIGLGGLALLVANSSAAFELRRTTDDKVLIWSESEVGVELDLSEAPPLAADPDAMRAGFVVWPSAGVPVQVSFRVATTPVVAGNDGHNVVRFERQDWSFAREVVATTVTTFERDSGFVVDSDILLNAVDHGWTNMPSRPEPNYDVQNVVAHEAGHFFGMGHEVNDGEATMYPTTPPRETQKRSLSADDMAGVAALQAEIFRRTGLANVVTAGGQVGGAEQSARPASADELQQGGCTVSGPYTANWGGLLLVLALGLLRARRFLLGFVAALVLLPATSAEATMVEAMGVDDLTDRSTDIVRGRVLNSAGVRIGGHIFTKHTLAATECFKGHCTKQLEVLTVGGAIGNLGMHVEGAAKLAPGQEVVLFGRRRGNAIRPVGLSQGLFVLRGDRAARDLRGLHLLSPTGSAVPGGGRIQQHSLMRLRRRVRARLDASSAMIR